MRLGKLLGFAMWLVAVTAQAKNPLIPEGTADKTLKEFSRQTGILVIYSEEEVKDVVTHAVGGDLGATAALLRMLDGTGLGFYSLGPSAVGIHSAEIAEVLVRATKEGASGVPQFQLDAADLPNLALNSVQETLQSLPQVRSDVCENTFDVSRIGQTNSTQGCGVDMRVGVDATQVLLNGRPVAKSGTEALFVDVSHIPISFLESVTVLPDESPLNYGAGGVGGTVDLVTRHSFDGAETQIHLSPRLDSATSAYLLSQVFGKVSTRGSLQFGVEYGYRSALPSSARRQATSDLTSLGGSNFDTLLGAPGTIYSATRTWAIPDFQKGVVPKPSDFVAGTSNLHDAIQGTDILPQQKHLSFLMSGTWKWSAETSAYIDVLLTRRAVADDSAAVELPITIYYGNPYFVSPLGTSSPVQIYYGFLRDLGPTKLRNTVWNGDLAAGFNMGWNSGWTISGYAGFSFEAQNETVGHLVNPYALNDFLASTSAETAFDPFVAGVTSRQTLEKITTHSTFRSDDALRMANVKAEGTLPLSPNRALTTTTGVDYRGEGLSTFERAGGYAPAASANSYRTVWAFFSQACMPLLGAGLGGCKVRKSADGVDIDLTAAARYEHYSDVRAETVPLIKLDISPGADIALQGVWRRTFTAPSLAELNQVNNSSEIVSLPNSGSPTGASNVLVWTGSNADLKPQAATEWSASMTVAPQEIPGLVGSVKGFDIEFANRIVQPTLTADALTSERGQQVVTFNPSAKQREAVCQGSQFSGLESDCLNAPVIALVDIRLNNLSKVSTNGLDLALSYSFKSGRGNWVLSASGTYIFKYVISELSGARNIVDSPGNPQQLRALGSVSWSLGRLETDTLIHYIDGYHDFVDPLGREVRSWTDVDEQIAWRFYSGLKLSLVVKNVFNVMPPFVNNSIGIGFDPQVSNEEGRVASLNFDQVW